MFLYVFPSICQEVMGPDAMILVLSMLSFKPTFSLSSFIFIKSLFSSSSLSAIRVVSSVELFQILKDDAVKVLHSMCQQIWKTQQWPQHWKRSVFIPIPKKWSEDCLLCPTLLDPMDCSLPGSSIHGIFQARILEWVAISFSRGSSRARDGTRVSLIVGKC